MAKTHFVPLNGVLTWCWEKSITTLVDTLVNTPLVAKGFPPRVALGKTWTLGCVSPKSQMRFPNLVWDKLFYTLCVPQLQKLAFVSRWVHGPFWCTGISKNPPLVIALPSQKLEIWPRSCDTRAGGSHNGNKALGKFFRHTNFLVCRPSRTNTGVSPLTPLLRGLHSHPSWDVTLVWQHRI